MSRTARDIAIEMAGLRKQRDEIHEKLRYLERERNEAINVERVRAKVAKPATEIAPEGIESDEQVDGMGK